MRISGVLIPAIACSRVAGLPLQARAVEEGQLSRKTAMGVSAQ